MNIRYIERDENGVVVGHYANPQPGTAEEALAEDHPDLVAYREAKAARLSAMFSRE